MNKEQKKKLGVLAVLGLALLVGGTFAFTAFNQQAINDRLRDNEFEVGGRVHDYYNRDTENKDVFVENYGQTPIMARIRLSEFMEIQERGQSSFTPVVEGTSRSDIPNWATYIPAGNNINQRTGEGADDFNQYSKLTFGWERSGQTAPWYLPTFNHVTDDHRTAAAGHARDYFTSNATDGSTDGATHPGDGTDAYWTEDSTPYDNSDGDWFGSQVTREVAQNLPQNRAPLTLQQWVALPNEYKIGDFWVIDHETGWAYWASQLQVGETSSYLLDAAEMEPAADDINGSYYYGIHVSSELISPEEEFTDEATNNSANLERLLTGIRNNAVEDSGVNPGANTDSSPSDFNFSTMNPGRIFTMAGEQYRYLEDMDGGNHLIIRNDPIRHTSFLAQNDRLIEWYEQELKQEVRDIVMPVANGFITGNVVDSSIEWAGSRWLPTNLDSFPIVANDLTTIVANGTKRAFALSLADVVRLSQNGTFNSLPERVGRNNSFWWLRTPGISGAGWLVRDGGLPWQAGQLLGIANSNMTAGFGGIRPALIIHQPAD